MVIPCLFQVEHGSKVLISMDLPSMVFVFKMDFKVHVDRYCNEAESRFRC